LLQAGQPAFVPPLPAEKQRAIGAIAVGHVVKLLLWFERQLWPDFVVLSTDGRIATWWPVESAATPTLMGYVGGPAALELEALGEQGVIALGLSELATLFGAAAAAACLGGRMTGWSADPWSRGAYTYSPLGIGDARAALAAPLGPLHFAGEATLTNGHIATVHGAIESGQRAADEVLAAI
jgi:monoamine oxidase